MNFAIIYTIIILILAVPIFLTDFAKSIPVGIRIFIIVFTLAFLWSYTIFFRTRGRLGFGGIILLILFYFITFVIIIPTGVGSTVISFLERGNMKPPITIGSEENTEQIYIVYHPGMSSFTIDALKILSENISRYNVKVTLYSINKNLQINLQNVKAIGFASPIYAGSVRQTLFDYIAKSDLSGKKCFVIVTGSDREGIEKDTLKVTKLIEEKGGNVIGKTKFINSDKENELKEKIEFFGQGLLKKL